jgi:hypothetical protein
LLYNSAVRGNYNGPIRQEYLRRVTELGELPRTVWTALYKILSMPFLDKMTSDGRPPATKGAAAMSANSCTAANTFSTHLNLYRRSPRWVDRAPFRSSLPSRSVDRPNGVVFASCARHPLFAASSLRRPHQRWPRFLSACDQIKDLFNLRRGRVTAAEHRAPGRRYSRSGQLRLPQFHS